MWLDLLRQQCQLFVLSVPHFKGFQLAILHSFVEGMFKNDKMRPVSVKTDHSAQILDIELLLPRCSVLIDCSTQR